MLERNTPIRDYHVVCNISIWDKTKSPYQRNKGHSWTLIRRELDAPAEWVKSWRLKRPAKRSKSWFDELLNN